MFDKGLTCIYTMLPSKFEQIGSYSPIAVGWADVPMQLELNSKLLEHEQSPKVSETLETVTDDASMPHAFPTESVLMTGKSSKPQTTLKEQSLFSNSFKETQINRIIAIYVWKTWKIPISMNHNNLYNNITTLKR